MKKNGFTLVELLAVIVILAVILVIAVPQINNVIKETRKNSLGSTAKLIAAKAEEKEVENDALERTESITCADLVKLDDNYGNCTVSKNSTTGKWEVTIVGANKFSGYTCTGTKDNMSCSEGSSSTTTEEGIYAFGSISSPSEGFSDYTQVKYADETTAQVFIKYPTSGTYSNSTTKSVCTRYDNKLTCLEMNASAYETNKSKLTTLFGSSKCQIDQVDGDVTYTECTDVSWYCEADSDGYVKCGAPDAFCDVYPDGSVHCSGPAEVGSGNK